MDRFDGFMDPRSSGIEIAPRSRQKERHTPARRMEKCPHRASRGAIARRSTNPSPPQHPRDRPSRLLFRTQKRRRPPRVSRAASTLLQRCAGPPTSPPPDWQFQGCYRGRTHKSDDRAHARPRDTTTPPPSVAAASFASWFVSRTWISPKSILLRHASQRAVPCQRSFRSFFRARLFEAPRLASWARLNRRFSRVNSCGLFAREWRLNREVCHLYRGDEQALRSKRRGRSPRPPRAPQRRPPGELSSSERDGNVACPIQGGSSEARS
jgi:hypothetical protein